MEDKDINFVDESKRTSELGKDSTPFNKKNFLL